MTCVPYLTLKVYISIFVGMIIGLIAVFICMIVAAVCLYVCYKRNVIRYRGYENI